MAVCTTSELDAALSYTLSSVKCGDILLKKEQREVIKLIGTSNSFAMRAGQGRRKLIMIGQARVWVV